eukprot:890996-Pyramimonas_sp.AAC.1
MGLLFVRKRRGPRQGWSTGHEARAGQLGGPASRGPFVRNSKSRTRALAFSDHGGQAAAGENAGTGAAGAGAGARGPDEAAHPPGGATRHP